MSTMYDALRKAEAENKKTAKLGEEQGSGSGDSVSSSNGMNENMKVMLLVIAVIVVFGFAIYQFNTAKKQQSMVTQKKSVATVTTQPSQPSATLAPVKPQRAPGTYGLDGVIDAGDQSMAIINGRLMKPEDVMDHLILKTISSKQVELLNTKDNSIVILKI